MFDELKKYKQNGHFLFKPADKMDTVCNAPKLSGVYVVYALKKGKTIPVCIGISDIEKGNGDIIPRKDGLYGGFINGEQFGGKIPITWLAKMREEQIEVLDIYWYVVKGTLDSDFPEDVQMQLLEKFAEINGALPKWNEDLLME